MLIPEFWADSRVQIRGHGKQITVRRSGWSMTSQAEAQAMAEARTRETIHCIVAGAKLDRRESKLAYESGTEGRPIREEVLSRHGDAVITRNIYGAHCLNSPNVLFADIDFVRPPASCVVLLILFGLLSTIPITVGIVTQYISFAFALLFFAALFTPLIEEAGYRMLISIHGGHKGLALQRIRQFIEKNPTWSLRLYETPAGFRLIATQRTFDPKEENVQSLFNALCVDKMYARLCKNQNCFRARLTAKPWRIGLRGLKPRRTWPVSDDVSPTRRAWIEKYEQKAAHFAACRFIETLGSGVIHVDVRETVELHDQLSRALQRHASIA